MSRPVVAFVDVSVVPLDRERVLPAHTVLIEGDRIVAVGPSPSIAVPSGARTIDGHGRFLIPGLSDMHSHILREQDLQLYVAKGVTTVRNMWGAPIHLTWRDKLKRGEMLGPTLITSGPIVDGDPPNHDGSLVVRNAEQAKQAIELHKLAGYDFIKVYTGLSLNSYDGIVFSARAAGLPIAGHVPRAVGLERLLNARQDSVEHMTGFVDALQRDDSPVAGKFDRASRLKKINFVDEKKIPSLINRVRERGMWNCPTRAVMVGWGSAEDVRRELQRPEMKYVPQSTRATWDPDPDDPEDLDSSRRTVALLDRLIGELHRAGAHVLTGTDPVNPLIVPGYSLHDELQLLVRAGLTPYAALRASTAEAAEYLHATGEFGIVAVGRRADLVMLEGNPLSDIAQTRRIAGVMVRGRYLDPAEIESILAHVGATIDGRGAPFEGMAELKSERPADYDATFEITWKDVYFGAERLVVSKRADGSMVVQAQGFDPHKAQRTALQLWAGPDSLGERVVVDSDGASGRGHYETTRKGEQAMLSGSLLSGVPDHGQAEVRKDMLLGADSFLATQVLMIPRLMRLGVGGTFEVQERLLSLGSSAKLTDKALTVVRTADSPVATPRGSLPARRFELKGNRGPASILSLNAQGWPVQYEIVGHGSVVRFSVR